MNQQLLSAQVVLQPASGISSKNVLVTSENISKYLPSKEKASAISKYFKDMGFEVGNLVGTSFSITAPSQTFEKTFKVKILHKDKKGVQCQWFDGAVKDHLPLNNLPTNAAGSVEAIVLPPPPDFGPGNY